ncbi:MAG: Na+/H+ antiporter subunit E [Anaerolineae bacterium]|nr:Na+/H+ antiporter subunit E [Anaerolineae bacterium]MCX8068410.1 Na+/H+ antiporter subunit E [Anaerolineae bacterium]MDW7991554.1 Na+/H+ antiporter subunit E [Anaerolineae bacterium]
MSAFLLNLLLALAWMALTGRFTLVNFAFGFAIGYGALWLAQRVLGPSSYFGKARRFLGFVLFFLWEVLKANLQVAYIVLHPRSRLRPGVIAVPLDARTDAEITLLANLITLTPGTLSIDVSADRKVLYVHTLDMGDNPARFRREIKEGLERRLLEVMR